jgi:para-nitrobenzyl esterase
MALPHGAKFEGVPFAPTFDGGHIIEHGVVYVSVNYRLGAFGYLALPELSADSPTRTTGNYDCRINSQP